jgi:hypothetical protein
MKTLIISTGREKEIMRIWFPSLCQHGKYNGDILLLNYDMNEACVRRLEQKKIIIKDTKQVYACIATDRFRAFYECLKDIWQNYDTILMIDADVEFLKPIFPLFEMSEEKLCYVKEITEWSCLHRIFNEITPESVWKYPDIHNIWESLKTERVINGGMFVGPAKIVFEVIKYIAESLPIDNAFGADQFVLNFLIYYYKTFPSQEIGNEWNYDARNTSRPKHEVSIYHRIESISHSKSPRKGGPHP